MNQLGVNHVFFRATELGWFLKKKSLYKKNQEWQCTKQGRKKELQYCWKVCYHLVRWESHLETFVSGETNMQQFSIQKRVQRTRTLMQIHCFTDILPNNYSSTFTNVLIWDLKRQCFCSVSSFAMIVLGLACKFPLNIYAKPTCCNDNQSSHKFFITFI